MLFLIKDSVNGWNPAKQPYSMGKGKFGLNIAFWRYVFNGII